MTSRPQANENFLNVAVALHLITDRQVVDIRHLLATSDPSFDLAEELVTRGSITAQQKTAVLAIMDQSISFVGDGGSPDESEPDDAPFEHTDGFSKTQVIDDTRTDRQRGTDSFAHYTITGTIGQGGLGRVVRGMDRCLRREVAIKEIVERHANHGDKRVLARFLNEARITGQLQHPGIVPVYQIGLKSDGNLFYVMKYVRGCTLEDALKECETLPKTERTAARLKLTDCLLDVCEAIGYAHERNVIHRDLKPDNIVMGHHGENVILDWGLAKHLGSESEPTEAEQPPHAVTAMHMDSSAMNLTREGEFFGTPAYMAPEQAYPRLGTVDKRSDVYALGVILFRILTGSFLYQADSIPELLLKVSGAPPSPDPTRINPDCPPDLAGICSKAINKDKHLRFQDAAAMAKELRAWRDGRTVSIYRYSTGELIHRFIQRNKALVAATCIAAMAIVLGLAFSVHYAVAANRLADAAQRNAERARTNAAEAREAEAKATANEKAAREAVQAIPRLQNHCLIRSEQLGREVQTLFSAIGTSISLHGIPAGELAENKDRAQLQLARISQSCPDFVAWGVFSTTATLLASWPDNAFSGFSPADKARDTLDWCLRNKKESLGKAFTLPDGSTVVPLASPVLENGEIVAVILGFFQPPNVLRHIIDRRKWGENWRLHKVFVHQEDGHELFDTLDKHWGKNLLTHPDYEKLQTLRDFVRSTVNSDHGVGEYVIHSDLNNPESSMVHKVGAWQTLRIGETAWKIVFIGAFKEGVGIVEQDVPPDASPQAKRM